MEERGIAGPAVPRSRLMAKKKKSERKAPEEMALPPGGVDSHAHLDLEHFAEGLDPVLDRALACGVSRTGNVFLGLAAYQEHARLFAHRPEVFFILGAHPNDCAGFGAEEARAMGQAFARDDRLRAVGEIGLDFYWDHTPRTVQHAAFKAQLALARELERPVVIHSREAAPQTLETLLAEGFSGYPLLWHCFGGDAALAGSILSHGWHLSLPGPVSYPANQALRDAVRDIPLDRLLLETDCPYLSPEPYRGKRNEPAYLVFTAHAVAAARGMDPVELWAVAGDNARRFFGLGADGPESDFPPPGILVQTDQ